MKIQSRDLGLLRLAYDHGFFLMSHAMRVFPNYSDARRRIGKLKNARLLVEEASQAWKVPTLIRLTRMGRYLIEDTLPYRIPRPVPVRPGLVIHDAQLIRARQRLDQLWQGDFIPEALLPKSMDVPDGIYAFPSGRKFYVELENSHKTRARFVSRLERFTGATATLYISTRPEVDRSIRKSLLASPGSVAAVIALDELETDKPEIWSVENRVSLFHQQVF